MTPDLRTTLCHSITRRAHLAGAEAAELGRLAKEARALIPQLPEMAVALAHPGGISGAIDDFHAIWQPAWDTYSLAWRGAIAARRRYWREVSAAARLSGMPWPEAEALGVEPQ